MLVWQHKMHPVCKKTTPADSRFRWRTGPLANADEPENGQ